jgi:hypothetical protein
MSGTHSKNDLQALKKHCPREYAFIALLKKGYRQYLSFEFELTADNKVTRKSWVEIKFDIDSDGAYQKKKLYFGNWDIIAMLQFLYLEGRIDDRHLYGEVCDFAENLFTEIAKEFY